MANLGDLRKIVYKTIESEFTTQLTNVTQIKLLTFNNNDFAASIYLIINLGPTNIYKLTLEINGDNNIFLKNINVTEGAPVLSIKYNINNGNIYLDVSNSGSYFKSVISRTEIIYGSISDLTITASSLTSTAWETFPTITGGNVTILKSFRTVKGTLISEFGSGSSILIAPVNTNIDSTFNFPDITNEGNSGTIALLENKLSDFTATTASQLRAKIKDGANADTTGTEKLVFSNSPVLTTPTLGAATATSINKVTITAPTTSSTLTIADGKTLTANKTITLDGADSTTLTLNKDLTVTNDNAGSIKFGAASKTLTINDSATIAGTGIVTLTEDATFTKALTVNTGDITLSGNASGSSVTLPASGTLVTLDGDEDLTGKTVNGLTFEAESTGFTIEGGTTPKTLTLAETLTVNTGTVTLSGNASGSSVTLPASGTLVSKDGDNDVTGIRNLTLDGKLTVSGTLEYANETNLQIVDKIIELGKVETPTNTTANGGGIVLLAGTDVNKSITWDSSNTNWTSSEHLNLLTGKTFKINNTTVLSNNTLGSGVTSSSLTSVGTLTSLAVASSATTTNIASITANSLTSGDGLLIQSTSVGRSGSLLNIVSSGSSSNGTTPKGVSISVTNSHPGTNQALLINSSGSANNIGIQVQTGSTILNNIRVITNTISSTDTNGSITLTPNGSSGTSAGKIILDSNNTSTGSSSGTTIKNNLYVSGNLALGTNSVTFNENSTFKTTLSATTATVSNKTITLPNDTGTVALTKDYSTNLWFDNFTNENTFNPNTSLSKLLNYKFIPNSINQSVADFYLIYGLSDADGYYNPISGVASFYYLGHPNHKFRTIYANSTTINSDRTLKQDIIPVLNEGELFSGFVAEGQSLNKLSDYYNYFKNVKLYNYNQRGASEERIFKNDYQVGVMAQEAEESLSKDLFYSMFERYDNQNGTSVYGLDQYGYTSGLVAALQVEIQKREAVEEKFNKLSDLLVSKGLISQEELDNL
jgi:hypothetical protein